MMHELVAIYSLIGNVEARNAGKKTLNRMLWAKEWLIGIIAGAQGGRQGPVEETF